jgi:peroxiredoxin Q/BCP
MLEAGQKAPSFKARIQDGTEVSLESILSDGNGLVLFFYPKDSTPGCTKEACDFRDAYEVFRSKGYRVMGVSKDSAKSHVRFSENNQLQFDVIVDEDLKVQEAYGVWKEKTNYGKTYMGTVRSTFVIDSKGIISIAKYNVRATGHVERIATEMGIVVEE